MLFTQIEILRTRVFRPPILVDLRHCVKIDMEGIELYEVTRQATRLYTHVFFLTALTYC